jgi:hypothetical protein
VTARDDERRNENSMSQMCSCKLALLFSLTIVADYIDLLPGPIHRLKPCPAVQIRTVISALDWETISQPHSEP